MIQQFVRYLIKKTTLIICGYKTALLAMNALQNIISIFFKSKMKHKIMKIIVIHTHRRQNLFIIQEFDSRKACLKLGNVCRIIRFIFTWYLIDFILNFGLVFFR